MSMSQREQTITTDRLHTWHAWRPSKHLYSLKKAERKDGLDAYIAWIDPGRSSSSIVDEEFGSGAQEDVELEDDVVVVAAPALCLEEDVARRHAEAARAADHRQLAHRSEEVVPANHDHRAPGVRWVVREHHGQGHDKYRLLPGRHHVEPLHAPHHRGRPVRLCREHVIHHPRVTEAAVRPPPRRQRRAGAVHDHHGRAVGAGVFLVHVQV